MRKIARTLAAASMFAIAGWTGGTLAAPEVPLSKLAQLTHFHGLAVDTANPSRLLLATHHGLFAVDASGMARKISMTGDDFMGFTPHPTAPGVLYASGHPASGGNLGFVVSRDGGATWSKLSDGIGGAVDFHQMDVSKADPAVVYGVYGVLQRSADGGRTWTAVGSAPAAIGPYVVPVVNLDEHLGAPNLNMVTCGGQATIPIVAAVSHVATVHYAEIVASIASKSAGPGTRANIDEFTHTTSRGLEVVGGARRGKAIIVLNPAEPPLIMRDTVFTLSEGADEEAIRQSVEAAVAEVQKYVPGYRLKQQVQFERFGSNNPLTIPGVGTFSGVKSSVFLEVEGAAHYLPAYAGNLDIMTSAALATAERLAERVLRSAA